MCVWVGGGGGKQQKPTYQERVSTHPLGEVCQVTLYESDCFPVSPLDRRDAKILWHLHLFTNIRC